MPGGGQGTQNGARLILRAMIILRHFLLKKALHRLMAAIIIDILRNRSHSTEGSIIYCKLEPELILVMILT